MGRWKPAAPFRVQYGEHGPKVRSDRRVCLVIYFYWMDREFGLMHVKLQTWFPFTVQVYVNGHEWLARKLAARGIAFEKHDNAFVELADVEKASECARGFWRRDWPKLLDRLAGRVNPLLKDWLAGQNYYWVIDQAEFSTDVLFADKTGLPSLRRSFVPARCALFWRGTDDDVFGTEVPRDVQGGSANALAATRAWCSRQALGQEQRDQDV